jgi:hypothetical protein
MSVSALFVDPTGPYPELGLDCWNEARDARLYPGTNPVVAHPPCARWSRFWWSARHLGKGLGDDEGCFESALDSVRRFGGVLEHPEGTHAWARFGLLRPARGRWDRTMFRPEEWTAVVDQLCYGHRARKRTWLLAVGCELLPPPMLATGPQSAYLTTPRLGRKVYVSSGPGTSQSRALREQHGVELMGKRERRLTPKPFAELLVAMAASVGARP